MSITPDLLIKDVPQTVAPVLPGPTPASPVDGPAPITALPGPTPVKGFVNTVRSLLAFSNDVIGRLDGLKHTYGDMVMMDLGGDFRQVLLSGPEEIHQVMVSQAAKFHKDDSYKDSERGLARFLGNGLIISDGEFWKRQRKLAAPALHAVRINNYAETMVDYTDRVVAGWSDGSQLDIHKEMKKLTMMIVAKTLFNADVSGEAERVHHALEALQDVAGSFSMLPPWVPTPRELRGRQAKKDLYEIILRLIRERRETGRDEGDLLSMLLLARDEDGSMMSEEQARDEALTLFLAGHETTANNLSWTLWLLSQHPEIMAKLQHELDTVLGGRLPTLADLKRLPYNEMVIKESLRLYAPVPIVSRVATEPVTIGGYVIPAGTSVALYIYGMHHDARWFPDPETFNPDRFLPDEESKMPKYAYVPFAAGPRVCIGNMFALMEAQLCLAVIVSRYNLKLKPGHDVKMHARITLNPKGGLPMIVERRTPAQA
jgi:cytochrome P450